MFIYPLCYLNCSVGETEYLLNLHVNEYVNWIRFINRTFRILNKIGSFRFTQINACKHNDGYSFGAMQPFQILNVLSLCCIFGPYAAGMMYFVVHNLEKN